MPESEAVSKGQGARTRASDDLPSRHRAQAARAEYRALLYCHHEYGRDMVCVRCSLPFERIQNAQIYVRENPRVVKTYSFPC
jgi:hypothetical protein